MDSTALVRLQSKFLLLGGIVLLTNVFLTLFLCGRRVQLQKEVSLDKERFYYAVQMGASNFLSSVVSQKMEHVEDEKNAYSNIKVQFIPSLSTWVSPRRGAACSIDDCVYRVGDYCEYGVIVSIADRRVYVDSGEGILILRRRFASSGEDAPTEEGRRTEGAATGG